MIIHRKYFLLLALILFSCSSIKIKETIKINYEEDWLFRGGNVENTNISKSKANLIPPFKILWDYDTEVGYSRNSLSVCDAVLFSSNLKGEVFAIDVVSGKSLGRFSSPGTASYSTPIIFNNNIIVAYTGDNKNSMLSYNISSGEINWKRKLGWIKSSPILIDNEIVVCSSNGKIYKLDATSGHILWSFTEIADSIQRKSFLTGPSICNQSVLAGNVNGYLYAIDLNNGNLKWRFITGGPIFADVSVYENDTFFASDDLYFYCLDTTGNLKWKKLLNTKSLSASTFYKEMVITSGIDGNIFAMDRNDGERVWTFQTEGAVWATPLLQDGKIFVGSYDRYFYCLDASDGSLLWKHEFENRIRSDAVIWKDFIFIACDDRCIYCFK